MDYQQFNFDGSPHLWINKIISSTRHLLVAAPGPSARQSEATSVSEKWGNECQIGLFTSASTGAPKCIWNTFKRLKLNASITAGELEISRSDRLLMMAKPWHIAGLSWMLMAEQAGADWHFMITKSGESQQWHQALQELQPDYLLTVPAVLNRLLAWENWRVPNIVFGGDALRKELYQPLKDHGQLLYQIYGQTEAGGMISCKKIDLSNSIAVDAAKCCGCVPEEFTIKCEGSQEKPAPVFLKSPTAAAHEFYNTGDFGFIGESEELYLGGRILSER